MNRAILHVDMDAFFAAVEQLDRPELRGRPVLVGGSPEGRGVVSTASYEARPFGCHSAMPMAVAVRKCPQAIIIRPRMERYAEVSEQVFAILEQFTPQVEPLSIDEAFLDLSGCERLLGPPRQVAVALRRAIREKVGLTASVGLATNKFLAKLASDLDKPDGLTEVPSDGVRAFLDPLPITRLWGAGKVTVGRFHALGVRTFGDAARLSEAALCAHFGQAGGHFFRLVRGEDDRAVVSDREAKSVSHENTFATDIADRDHLRSILLHQVERVGRRLRRHDRSARTVTLKVRTPDFRTFTRSSSLPAHTDCTDLLWQVAARLFDAWTREHRAPVRLLGIGVSQLASARVRQLTLIADPQETRRRDLDRTLDSIQDRFGDKAIARGRDRSEERDPE